MPDSKLVENLGFRVEDKRFIRNNEEPPYNRIALSSEIALWNLCLEQERLLELYRAKRASDGGPGREWHAGKHLAAEEAIEIAERKDA